MASTCCTISSSPLLFDENLFTGLTSPTTSNTDWDVLNLQPDSGIPAAGELDLIALADNPSLDVIFTQPVSWLSTGSPGIQPFLVYDETFTSIQSGVTGVSPSVPEPSTLLLLGGALAAVLAFRQWIRTSHTLVAAGTCLLVSQCANAEIRVTARTLINSTRVNLTEYDYTYLVTVQNLGAAATHLTAVVTSFAPATKVQAGNLTFPDIPAGATVNSRNTYTVRQDRTAPIDHSLVRLAFSAISTPVADAGPDQFITALNAPYSQNVARPTLCCAVNAGRSYDPFGLPLTYHWTLISRPAGSNISPPNSGFVPDLPGDYAFQLIVNNGYLDSAPSTIRLSTIAVAPKADAGLDQTIHAGQTVQLDGTGSVNEMGRPISYNWSLVSAPAGSNAVLSDPTSPRPTLFASVAGKYKAQLQVSDGPLTSAPSIVTLTTGNTPPHADAGPHLHIAPESLGFLSADCSTDANGDFLTYRWAILSGSGSLALPPVANPEFFIGEDAFYHIQLFVHDGYSESISTQLVTSQNIFPLGPCSVSFVALLGFSWFEWPCCKDQAQSIDQYPNPINSDSLVAIGPPFISS
jgi:hypothetical protein